MIPIGDSIKPERKPIVTPLLILGNTLIFVLMILTGNHETWIRDYGLVASNFSIIKSITATFIHGDLIHLFFNMLFLWIFGANVEDALGRKRYLIFYITAGMAASIFYRFFNPSSIIPAVGSSGAIYGVLAAYVLLYPLSEIRFFMFNIFALQWVFANERLPKIKAIYLVLLYFLLDLYGGLNSLVNEVESNIGHFAHIGGFVFGMAATFYLITVDIVEAPKSIEITTKRKPQIKEIPDDEFESRVKDMIDRYEYFHDDVIYSLTRNLTEKTGVLITDYELKERIIRQLLLNYLRTVGRVDNDTFLQIRMFLREKNLDVTDERLKEIIENYH